MQCYNKIGQDFDYGHRSPYRQLRASECHNFLDSQVDLMPIFIIYTEYWKHEQAIYPVLATINTHNS